MNPQSQSATKQDPVENFDFSPASESIDRFSSRSEKLLRTILAVFIVQIAGLILLSFVMEAGLQFTTRIFYQQETPTGYNYYPAPVKFQFDFSGYYSAAKAWRTGADPYAFIFAAPSSLLIIVPFTFLGLRAASLLFFTFNVSLFLYSLTKFCRHIGLSRLATQTLLLLTILYYPFVFMADRGNVDGVVVSLAMLAFCAQRQWSKAILWGASAAAKLYTGLLIPVFFRNRQRKLASLILLVFVIFQLPFLRNESAFLAALLGRGGYMRPFGNTSPFVLFELFAPDSISRILFLIFWGGTLAYRLWHDRSGRNPELWVDYIPWMVSVPLVVFPYESVFLLPMLAVYAKRFQTDDMSGAEGLFVPGFLLTGFHPAALASLFGLTVVSKGILDLVNVVGLTLVMVATAFAAPARQSSQ